MPLSSTESRSIPEDSSPGQPDQQPVAGQVSGQQKTSWFKSTAIHAFFQYLFGRRKGDEDYF